MSETNHSPEPPALSPLKRALLALQDLRSRLEAAEGARREPIAIIGMGCRFPGGADGPAAFWRLLRDGRDAITEVPAGRWDIEAFYNPDPQAPGKMSSRFGGFVDGVENFDASFFGIAPREAVSMDPQQRLLLEVTWEALEHAGQAPPGLRGSRAGVFIGIANCDYLRFHLTDITQVDAYSSTGNANSIAAGRLSYTLGLQGPSMAVDTACSSSLVAVHLAAQSLRSGESDLALAGGVNVILSPDATVALSKAQMLAVDGRCKTFDAAADGYVRSEGCGIVVLKRLSDALEDGDNILAVIRGSAVNQDGRSNGLTAPNGLAQREVIRAAIAQAGVAPTQVSYIEAHGTGTALGDPMEVQALDAVLGEDRPASQPLLVGSVKTNLGHLETAAGIAGLIKVVLALQHGEIPPHLHLCQPSPHIPWDQLPIRIPTARTAWPPAQERRVAGVSSFGYSGTNAHLVLEEAPVRDAAPVAIDRPRHILTLSAKQPAALAALAERYARLLADPGAPPLADICYTANTGRSHFAHRLAVVGATAAEISEKLLTGVDVFRGDASEPGDEIVPRQDANDWEQHLEASARLYVQGGKIDWAGLDRDHPRKRVPLPTYPFQRQRYWAAQTRSPGHGTARPPHPFIEQRLTLPLRESVFETRLRPDAPAFLTDHRIQGIVVLPGAVYLEMALAAAGEALGSGPHVFTEISFSEPLILADGEEQSIDLVLTPRSDDEVLFQVFRRAGQGWRLHAGGTIRKGSETAAPQRESIAAIRERCSEPLDAGSYYDSLRGRGLEYGPAFQGITWIARGPGEALGRIQLSETLEPGAYRFHPALLDACLQVLGAALGEGKRSSSGESYVLAGMERFCVYRRPDTRLWSHARMRTGADAQWDISLLDDEGNVVADVLGLREQRAAHLMLSPAPEPADWLYTLEWKPKEHPRAESPLAAALASDLPHVRSQFALDAYEALMPGFDALCRAWAERALRTLGWHRGAAVDPLGVLPQHRRLFERLIEMVRADPGEVEPKALSASLAARFPGCAAEVAMLERCGQNLAEVLQGKCDPLQLLFPEGSLALLERAYAEEPFARAGNALIQRAIAAVIEESPLRRPVHILEIGAGTGGTTSAILPQLPPDRVGYTFTDVSQIFLRKARQKFRDYPFVTYQLLDIERDPESQGLAPHHFDIVVAANVLHATSDLRRTLGNVQKLLSSEGRLILLEGTAPQHKTDLIFGLTAGWWRFTDTDIRPTHPLLPARSWLPLLEQAGFVDAAAVPGDSSPWAVIVARGGKRPVASEPWLILPDRRGVSARLVALLDAHGERCLEVDAGALEEIPSCRGVVHLLALDESPSQLAETERRLCGGALQLIQSLARAGRAPAPLWLVTAGAQAVGAGVTAEGVAQAPLWGLGRVLANEHPELFGGLVDLDPAADPHTQAALLFDAIHRPDGEKQLTFREDKRFVARLVRAKQPAAIAPQFRENGSYLITGGLGGLGLAVARWMVTRGARRLVLAGRNAPSTTAAEIIREIEREGASVAVAQTDVGQVDSIAALLTRIETTMPPLCGIIHAAGVLDDGVLLQQDWPRFAAVLAPKVEGAWNLHTLTRHLPLDFFVLFSSASALMGAPGQANYAAANAFLDALAHHRRSQGATAVSIDWGPWAEVGMAAALDPAVRQRYAVQGLGTIAPPQGLRVLESLLYDQRPQVAVLPVRWPAYLRQFSGGMPPLFTEIGSAAPAETKSSGGWRTRIAAAEPAARRDLLTALVQEQAANVLRLDYTGPLSPREPLQELGLDSLMAVELRNALGDALGRTLPATLIFDYPTIELLAGFLDRAFVPVVAPAVAPQAPPRYEEHAAAEPIAILGMGCRIPGGGNDPGQFWQLLRDGVDAITEVPPERWDVDAYYNPDPDAPGKMYTRWGGFLTAVDRFDAQFFGITPREAVSMDPQQRLLLEVSWEALERAGQAPDQLQGSQTGVFVGISCYDYYHLARRSGDEGIDAYSSTGVTFSVAAGRLAYVLGLQGPTMAIDTACSSSLVTIHLACQSLRNRECDLALAGGVNLMLSPENYISSCRLRAMAADGRCKTFDAKADGYVRGEGCGIVVLKRLSEALRDRDPVVAVIRGSAVNQDGRSNGLTAPNGPAQEAVLRKALATAGLRGDEVGYVEAHGTGTPLGDPIELHALGTVLGAGRGNEHPLMVASLKTNIGHLESAAGVAGVIKASLIVQRGEVPAHLHLDEPNPYIAWHELPIRVPTSLTPWPANGRRIAGVSAFAYSGTNAHIIVEQPPDVPAGLSPDASSYLLPISARTAAALEDLARAYADLLAAEPKLHDVCYTASVRRSHHEHRLAVTGRSAAELRQHVTAWLDHKPDSGTTHGVSIPGQRRRLVFVFPGQGSQWIGMGRELLAAEPPFRAAMEQCDAAVRAETGWSVIGELAAADADSRLGQINVIQPVLFAMQVALAALWRSWGIRPDAVIGHSMGEVAAAQVAGALSLEEAARIICRRSRLLTRVSGRGAMAVAELSVEEAQAMLAPYSGRLAVAVSNSPRSTVLAGDPTALREVLEALERRGVFCRWVKVDVASHSPYMDELRDDLLHALNGLASQPAGVPMYSTVSSEAGPLDAAYWVRNLREPVRFAEAIGNAAADGHDLFLEISPHPVLLPAIEDNLRHLGGQAIALPSLRREEPERATLLGTLGALYTKGFAIDWRLLYPAGGESVPLPAYPWQRQRFWITDGQAPRKSLPEATSLLGTHLESSLQPGTHLWERELSLDAFPYLRDHTVQGLAVLPAAAYLELACSAGTEVFGGRPAILEDVAFEQMLVLPEGETRTVQFALSGSTFQIMSRQPDSWTVHARGTIRPESREIPAAQESLAAIQARCPEVHSGAELYQALQQRGLEYGASFQGVKQTWRGEGEALGLVHLPSTTANRAGHYQTHPALLDAGFHVMALAVPAAGEIYLPVALRGLRVFGDSENVRWSYARTTGDAASHSHTLAADVFLLDEQGQTIIEARGLTVKRLEQAAHRDVPATDDWLFEVQWQPQILDATEPAREGRWLVFADRTGMAAALASLVPCDLVYENSQSAEDFRRLLHHAGPLAGIVHLWSLDALSDDVGSAQDKACLSTVRLIQALADAGWRDAPRLYLVTRGAQTVDADDPPPSLAQAPLWGLGRTISYEYPELACTKIDLDGRTPGTQSLARELLAADHEDQVAWRGDARYVARLVRRRFEAATPREASAGQQSFRLELLTPGVLDGLSLRAIERPKPGPGEVEIEVCAAGLNFLDVLTALGAIPVDPPSLGSECAGRVAALGEGVPDLAIGQEVLAIAPWSFGCYAMTPRALVAPKPAHLSFHEAATIPVAFLTAWYALHHVARLMPGERVLIHAASGGVGAAAVQIAQRLGAEIFATAGSPEKRAWLKAMGVRHVMDSRSLAFANEVREYTGGEGVDVVLNSLAGEFIDASLELLRDYGRFVEIGKRDYFANRALGSRPFLRNLSFSLVDLRGMTRNRPDLLRSLLAEVLQLFETGQLRPIAHRVMPIAEAREAFRLMAQAKHIGKIVLSLDGRESTRIVPSEVAPLFRADGTYVITGGLGGLGLITARWMVEQGARHLVLMGRSAPSPDAEVTLASLRETGAKVIALRADVANQEELAAALAETECTMPALAGVIHAAGVLDDGLLARLDRERFEKVAAPKIAGAWNLHLLTRGRPLDFFVLYSSGSSILGSPGQGNYAAANAFLDALAHYRRAEGLPAMSINWGPWAEVGLSAAQANRGDRLAQRGFDSISPAQGMEMLGRLLRQPLTQIGVLPINLRQWRQFYPQLAQIPLLAELIEREETPRQTNHLRAALLEAAPAERAALLETHLQEQMARVVRLPAEQIEPHTSFKSFGLDSLMALELRNCLEASLSLTLPVTMIFGYPTVTALAAHLLSRLEIPTASKPDLAETPSAAEAPAVERIAQLSDEEVDRLLAARAGRKES